MDKKDKELIKDIMQGVVNEICGEGWDVLRFRIDDRRADSPIFPHVTIFMSVYIRGDNYEGFERYSEWWAAQMGDSLSQEFRDEGMGCALGVSDYFDVKIDLRQH